MMNRVVLFPNGHTEGGKVVVLPTSMHELLETATEKFGFVASCIYTVDGSEVHDIRAIKYDEHLFVLEDCEEFLQISSTNRIVLYRNGCQSGGHLIARPNSTSDLLQVASDLFGFDAKYLYTAEGLHVNDIRLIRSDERVYAAGSESFLPPSLQRHEGAPQQTTNFNTAPETDKSGDETAPSCKLEKDGKDLNVGGTASDLNESGDATDYGSKPEEDWIRLNVGGTYFKTSRTTLQRAPNSMLGKMFDKDLSMNPSKMDATGAYLIDRDPAYFRVILNYLRSGELALDNHVSLDGVLTEAKFFGIDSILDLQSDVVRLNVGGKCLFSSRTSLLKIKKNSINMTICNADKTGAYYVDRDPTSFALFLDFLRDGELSAVSAKCSDLVAKEAAYFGIDYTPPELPQIVRLNVGGKYMITSRSSLNGIQRHHINLTPSNMDETGAYFVDRDPVYFELFLNTLRGCRVVLKSEFDYAGLNQESEYFGVEMFRFAIEGFPHMYPDFE